MPRPVTYIPFLTTTQIRELAGGSYNEYHRIYTQVHRIHTKSYSDAIKKAQKKYREKKKLEDPSYIEKQKKAHRDWYLRHKDDPERKEKMRIYYQKKKLEKSTQNLVV